MFYSYYYVISSSEKSYEVSTYQQWRKYLKKHYIEFLKLRYNQGSCLTSGINYRDSKAESVLIIEAIPLKTNNP